jgi:hypothetical protein
VSSPKIANEAILSEDNGEYYAARLGRLPVSRPYEVMTNPSSPSRAENDPSVLANNRWIYSPQLRPTRDDRVEYLASLN